jgi:putative nucleotidyltransferase with HDIG domain
MTKPRASQKSKKLPIPSSAKGARNPRQRLKKNLSSRKSRKPDDVSQLKRDIKKYRHQLEVIRKTSLKIATDLSLEPSLEALAVLSAEFFSADAVTCMFWDPSKKNLIFKSGYGFKSDYIKKQCIPRERIDAILQSDYEFVYTEDLRKTPYGDPELIRRENLVSVLSLIMRYGGEIQGAINIYSRNKIRRFTPEEIENAHIFGQQATIAIRNANLYSELREEAQIAKTLLQVAEDVGSLGSLSEVLNRIAFIITKVLNFKISLIFLWDRQKKLFLPAKAVGLPPHRSPLFETLILRREDLNFTEAEIRQREVVCASDAPGHFPVEKLSSVLEVRDFQIVPLVIKNQILGALISGGYQGEEPFDTKAEMFMRGIAAHAAIAIDDANLVEDLEAAFLDIIKSLATAIEVKDRYTHSHSESVVSYALAIARQLNLTDKDIDLLRKACLLHDVGKIGVEDSILKKTSPLTPEEWAAIKVHPVVGAEILGMVCSLSEVSVIVRHHHEHYDGGGYPDKLKGEQIPLFARILQIADSFDAMTSDRPYRQALSQEEAIKQLKLFSGRQFDPKLVEVFLRELTRMDMRKIDRPQAAKSAK